MTEDLKGLIGAALGEAGAKFGARVEGYHVSKYPKPFGGGLVAAFATYNNEPHILMFERNDVLGVYRVVAGGYMNAAPNSNLDDSFDYDPSYTAARELKAGVGLDIPQDKLVHATTFTEFNAMEGSNNPDEVRHQIVGVYYHDYGLVDSLPEIKSTNKIKNAIWVPLSAFTAREYKQGEEPPFPFPKQGDYRYLDASATLADGAEIEVSKHNAYIAEAILKNFRSKELQTSVDGRDALIADICNATNMAKPVCELSKQAAEMHKILTKDQVEITLKKGQVPKVNLQQISIELAELNNQQLG